MKRLLFYLAISMIFISLSTCRTPHTSIKKNFNFSRIKKIAVWGIEDFRNMSDSGEIVMSEVALCLTKTGYDVIERSKLNLLLKELSISQGGLTQGNYKNIGKMSGADAIVTGSIIQYQSRKVITLPIEIIQEGNERIETYFDSSSGRRVPMKVKSGTTRTKRMEVKAFEASFGLHLRLIEVTSGEVVWASTFSYNALDITRAITETVTKLTSTLPSNNTEK